MEKRGVGAGDLGGLELQVVDYFLARRPFSAHYYHQFSFPRHTALPPSLRSPPFHTNLPQTNAAPSESFVCGADLCLTIACILAEPRTYALHHLTLGETLRALPKTKIKLSSVYPQRLNVLTVALFAPRNAACPFFFLCPSPSVWWLGPFSGALGISHLAAVLRWICDGGRGAVQWYGAQGMRRETRVVCASVVLSFTTSPLGDGVLFLPNMLLMEKFHVFSCHGCLDNGGPDRVNHNGCLRKGYLSPQSSSPRITTSRIVSSVTSVHEVGRHTFCRTHTRSNFDTSNDSERGGGGVVPADGP